MTTKRPAKRLAKRKRRPPLPKPSARAPAEQQPCVRQEANGAWAVVQDGAIVKSGFASMAQAWAHIDRNEARSLSETNAGAVRYGRYKL